MSNTPLVIDQQAMKEHFIAIRYVHGSGGHFLNAWLTASKLNLSTITLGEYGSAHPAFKEFGAYKKPPELPSPHFNIKTPPPYFLHTEYRNLDLIADNFYKVINVVYDIDDCNELELSFLGKYYLENTNNSIPTYLRQHAHRQKYFSLTTNTTKLLNISWKELLHYDAHLLVDKLKIFTGLLNIVVEPLYEWRQKTKNSMDKTILQVTMNEDTVDL